MIDWLLSTLVFSTIFERFNVFLRPLDFSLKLSLILLSIVGLILLFKRRLIFNPTFLFPFLAFLLLVETFSIPFSFNPFQSFQVVVFHLLMIGLFYLIVWSTRKESDLTRLVYAWGAGVVAVALIGFWQFVQFVLKGDPTVFLDHLLAAKTLPAANFVQEAFGKVLLRPSSTFIDVNTAASFVGIFLLLGLGWFLSSRNRSTSYFLLATSLIMSLIYFLLASSRSAAFGLGSGAILFGYLLFREKIKRRLLVGSLLLLLGLLVGVLAYFSFADPVRLGSSLARVEYAKEAAAMLKHNPLFGVGAGNFEPYCTKVLRPDQPVCYSHSILLTWLGELGVLGLAANLLLINAVVYFLWRNLRKVKYNSSWYTRLSGLLGAMTALVSANIFHAHYGLDFTWVLLGLVVSGYYLSKTMNYELRTPKLDVLGVHVDNVTMSEAVEKVRGFFKAGKKAYVVTPNPEMIVRARQDHEFAELLNMADLSVPDGMGLVWASRIWGTSLKERVSGMDLFLELCAEAARRGGKVFLLGGAPGVAEKTAQVLRERYPKLRIAGTFAGDGSPAGDVETVKAIKSTVGSREPVDLLFVAYGHGKQERWIRRNLEKVPVKVAMVVGGAFDYVAGAVPRAPEPLRRLGLEWLYRLLKQPWRLRRQLALLKFIVLVFREQFVRSGS